MKKTYLGWNLGVLAMATSALASGGVSSSGTAPGRSPADLVGADNQHGFALAKAVGCDALSRNPNANLFLSPSSSAMALEMLLNGAGKGSATYTELAQALHLGNLSLDEVNELNRALMQRLQTPPPVQDAEGGQVPPVPFTLSIANSAWSSSRSDFRFNPAFVSSLERNYSAEARQTDFQEQSGMDAINGWASEKTHGRISGIVDENAIHDMDFLLMNATYFKANWQMPFNKYFTHSDPFTKGDGTRSMAETMHATLDGYTRVGDTQVMELPYAGGTASMYVVLPPEGRSVASAILDGNGPMSQGFWDEVARAPREEADFSMPRFSFRNELALKQPLESMGLQALFTPGADLSQAGSGDGNESVSQILQDTFVKVDEMGTEAAAVTAILAGAAAAMSPPPFMKVDRPFLVSIVEKRTGLILFEGVVSNPGA